MVHALALCLLLVLALPAWAVDYYANTATGSDIGTNCTVGQKCASVNRAVEVAVTGAGDRVLLECSQTFRETSTIVVADSGSSGNPITLTSTGTCFVQESTHSGSNNASVLEDGTADFVTLGVAVGQTLFNLDDASSCNVTSLTATTLTCSLGLAYGKENDWDTGDRYRISNYPIITHASLLNSGWTNQGSNVWSHTVNGHPGRQVWLNGYSPNSSHWTGTCSAAGMVGASTHQWCATSTNVYVKNATNPASAYTAPGVEVVHLFGNQSVLWSHGSRNWWVIENVQMQRVYGFILTTSSASNLTIRNARFGWSQRHNCATACWNGNNYTWLSGQDDRGGGGVTFSGSSPYGSILMQNTLLHDCDNNCTHTGGPTTVDTVTYQDVEAFNNFHSAINLGTSSGGNLRRNITMTRLNIHDVCTGIHTGATSAQHQNTILQDSDLHTAIFQGDTRIFAPLGGCGAGAGIGWAGDDPTTGAGIILRNTIVSGWRIGVNALGASTYTLTNNTIYGNTEVGVRRGNVTTAPVTITNTLVAENGTGGVANSNFQLGCGAGTTSCTNVRFTGSDYNKYRQPDNGNFGYLNGIDTSMSMAEWQTQFSSDANSVNLETCLVNPAARDFNHASGCDDIDGGNTVGSFTGSARDRGALESVLLLDAQTVTANSWALTFDSDHLPLEVPNCTGIVPHVDTGGGPDTRSASNCVVNSNVVTFTVSGGAPVGGNTLTADVAYGAITDTHRIGGVHNAKVLAQTGIAVTNTIGGASPTYTQTHWQGYQSAVSTEGTNRFCPGDGECPLFPGGALVARAQVEVEGGAAPSTTYEFWCSDDANPYYQVGESSSGWMTLATSLRNPAPVLTQQLPLDGDTYEACGGIYLVPFMGERSCSTPAAGYRFEYEAAMQLSASATIGTLVRCRLRQNGGVVLDNYNTDMSIRVSKLKASGF